MISQLLRDLAKSAEAQTRINAILDKYQEQSQLLDPHLDKMVTFPCLWLRDADG